jgi:hypothetical protein
MFVLAMFAPCVLSRAAAQMGPAVCNPKKQDCGCERNWGCWELLYTTKGTILGVKGTGTLVTGGARDTRDAGVVTSYFTEHYGTRKGLAGHFLLFGTIGGGTAGTEGSLGGSVDFGLRLLLSETSGPFLRVGPSGMLLGHRRLTLSMIEPLQGHLGYQFLDGDHLVEWGVTFGEVFAGRYEAADATRNLGYALQLGGYFIVRFTSLRFDASLTQLQTSSGAYGSDVWLGRAAICDSLRPAAICVELLDTRGAGLDNAGARQAMRSLYVGLGVGLTP